MGKSVETLKNVVEDEPHFFVEVMDHNPGPFHGLTRLLTSGATMSWWVESLRRLWWWNGGCVGGVGDVWSGHDGCKQSILHLHCLT